MSDEDFRLLSLREAGELLGIEAKAVKALIETGEIGAYRTGASGQYRIPRIALVARLDAQRAELRALLSPLLDVPWELGLTTMGALYTACRFCRTREAHAPGCPVQRRDELLGRSE